MISGTRSEQLLEQILVWIRASSFSTVGEMLAKALPSDNMRLAYQALDGTKTIDKVKKECGIWSNTINTLVNRCGAMGLMSKGDGPATRLFDLADFGLLPASAKTPDASGESNE